MLNSDFILINFLDEWISVDPRAIQIDNFNFPNIEDDNFAVCLIEDKNGNKGLALLSGKIVKQINNGSLRSSNTSHRFRMYNDDTADSAKFSPKTEQIFKNYADNISKHRATFLSSICSDSGVCIALGKQTKRISKHFKGFVNFEYVISPIKTIGRGGHGFIKSITYERDGYTANAILKSSNRPYSDNLLFEYIVGQYINKQCLVFPCFIETYGWYQYKTDEDWSYMKKNPEVSAKQLKDSLEIGEVALKKYINSGKWQKICYEDKTKKGSKIKDCTELDYLLKVACAKSQYLSILIQSINNTKDMQSMITLPSEDSDFNFPSKDLLNVLYQIYMPLATLSETFTHYDLHSRNVLIYEPVPGKYIDYKYVLDDGSIVEFKCRYIAKIIDYGHAFFKDDSNTEISGSSKSIYETICKNIEECGDMPGDYCGKDKGFSSFGDKNILSGYSVDSCLRNRTHDLLLLYRIKKELKRPSWSDKDSNPFLQNIFDNLEYGNEVSLEADELETGFSAYEFGSVEKLSDSIFPERINNVIDAHNALKTAVLHYKIQNDLDHQALTSFGSLTIYQSGHPMKFIQN